VRKTFLSFGIVLALVAVFFTTTAFTNAPTARAATQPHGRSCPQGWVDDSFTLIKSVNTPDGTPETIVNNTDQTITRTVSTTTTLSVSASVSYTQDVSETQVLVSEKESLGITVQGTITVARGESTVIPVGPHKTVQYGDYIHTDTFAYHEYYLHSDCSIGTDNGYQTLTGPTSKTWIATNI
jgi:hypothetical protein